MRQRLIGEIRDLTSSLKEIDLLTAEEMTAYLKKCEDVN